MSKQYQTCQRCNGFRNCWWDSKMGHSTKCHACDGLGVIPANNDWRPHEPCKENSNGD